MQAKTLRRQLSNSSAHSETKKKAKRTKTAVSTNQTNHPYTELALEDLIKQKYNLLLKELSTFLVRLCSGRLVFNFGNNVVNSVPADLVRSLSEWSQDDFVDLAIRNIIVDAIVSSENKQVGSGVICALALLSNKKFDSDIKKYRNRAELHDLDKTIDYFLGSGNLSKVTKQSIGLGSLNGSLRFDISNNKDFLISAEPAIKIKGFVHPMFDLNKRWVESVTLVCVDGVIESLGEIDSILQGSSVHKNNVIILATNYHPDIINTLNVNFKDNRLNVIPFVVEGWGETPGTDALEACANIGIDCVSRERGDVLAAKTLDDFSIVKSTYISANSIAIHNDGGNEIHTMIKVPNTVKPMAGLIEDRVRITLQSCKGIARWGLIKDHDILNVSHLDGLRKPMVPVSALYFGIQTAERCKENINNLGAIIIPDIK